MGNFKRLLRQHGDWKTFEAWMRRCERDGGQGKRALDAYERSLRRCELAEMELEVWTFRHIDDEFYEAAAVIKRKGLEHLQALSLKRLERVFAQFKRDSRK
jgi:hypothetical protein